MGYNINVGSFSSKSSILRRRQRKEIQREEKGSNL
jgi:hypothetical protein